jgi:hypothetical protein
MPYSEEGFYWDDLPGAYYTESEYERRYDQDPGPDEMDMAVQVECWSCEKKVWVTDENEETCPECNGDLYCGWYQDSGSEDFHADG